MKRTARVLAGALFPLLSAGPAWCQTEPRPDLPTVLEGLTVDARTGLPFPNVQVRVDTGERITSDDEGRYALEGLAPGRHQVALVTARCNVTFAEVELASGEIKQVAFAVPSEMVGTQPSVAEMKRRSEGEYYGAEDLRHMNARNLLEALRRIAPDMVGADGGQPGATASLMGRTRTAQGATPPIVVFDGIVVSDGVRALRDLRPTDVASLEVLRGAGRGWAYGTGGAGGVIRVVTQQGQAGHGLAHPDRCEIGDWANSGRRDPAA